MSGRQFSAKFTASSARAARSSYTTSSAVPKRDVDIQFSGPLENLNSREYYMNKSPSRSPKEYMFARTDFSVEQTKLQEVLDTGVLFRYHEPNAEDIPVAKLEQAFCEKFGFKYALGVNSASSGLLLSLLASGVQNGDNVLMPAFTFVAVPSSIVLSGANPVLVEINEDYSLDPDHLEKQIAKY
jgi:hypothetical protein